MTLTPMSFPALTTILIVSGCARSMTTTCVAPALAIISASSQPPSIVFKSATIGTLGNSARNARTPVHPLRDNQRRARFQPVNSGADGQMGGFERFRNIDDIEGNLDNGFHVVLEWKWSRMTDG